MATNRRGHANGSSLYLARAQDGECEAEAGFVARCLADVEPEPVRWLWPDRIARGKINLIAGHPGRGKSTLTLYLAALVSRGGVWPDGAKVEQGSVVLITCEDDIGDTIVPRLIAMEADRDRIHTLDAVRDDKGNERPFDLASGLKGLAALAAQIERPVLIVIDPISAYLDRVDSHNNAEVRGALRPLQELAAKTGAAVLMVSHFNKGTLDNSAMSRISGSGAFAAVCRSAWIVERDPAAGKDQAGRRILAPIKNNIGNDREGFAFEIERAEVRGIRASQVRFLPGVVDVSADELLRGASGAIEVSTRRADAKDFLLQFLADGPRWQTEIEKAAETEGHALRTIKRAKKDGGIRSGKCGGAWFWSLPEHKGRAPAASQQGCQAGQHCQGELGAIAGPVAVEGTEEGQLSPPDEVGPLGSVGLHELQEPV